MAGVRSRARCAARSARPGSAARSARGRLDGRRRRAGSRRPRPQCGERRGRHRDRAAPRPRGPRRGRARPSAHGERDDRAATPRRRPAARGAGPATRRSAAWCRADGAVERVRGAIVGGSGRVSGVEHVVDDDSGPCAARPRASRAGRRGPLRPRGRRPRSASNE